MCLCVHYECVCIRMCQCVFTCAATKCSQSLCSPMYFPERKVGVWENADKHEYHSVVLYYAFFHSDEMSAETGRCKNIQYLWYKYKKSKRNSNLVGLQHPKILPNSSFELLMWEMYYQLSCQCTALLGTQEIITQPFDLLIFICSCVHVSNYCGMSVLWPAHCSLIIF